MMLKKRWEELVLWLHKGVMIWGLSYPVAGDLLVVTQSVPGGPLVLTP